MWCSSSNRNQLNINYAGIEAWGCVSISGSTKLTEGTTLRRLIGIDGVEGIFRTDTAGLANGNLVFFFSELNIQIAGEMVLFTF